MPQVLSKPIHHNRGALLHATVGLHAGYRRWLLTEILPHAPTETQAVLLVDTGATYSCLDRRIVKHLRLKRKNWYPIITPGASASELWPTYDISIQLRDENGNQHDIPALEICSATFSQDHYQGLLGRDILSRCNFHYDGPRKKFTLEF